MAISEERSRAIFKKTEKELARLPSIHRAEAIHGFRTSARRLQTLLAQLVADNEGKHRKLLKTLNRIRKSAGRVRDIDVQLEALRALKVPQEPRRKTQLMQSLIELRGQQERKFRKLLKKQDLRDIRKRLRRAEGVLSFRSSRDPLSVARQILASVQVPKGLADEATLHRYRLAVKRARYTAEFALKSPETTKLLVELKRLQDALGSWHDWLTLTHTATEHLGSVHESSLVALLHNVTRVKFRHALNAVVAAKTDAHVAQLSASKPPAGRKTAQKDIGTRRRHRAAA